MLSKGEVIAYAYMKNGRTLVSISDKYKQPEEDEDIEIIKITESGFYPDYYLSIKDINGDTIYCNMADWQNEKKGIEKKCDSEYTTHSAGQVLFNISSVILGSVTNFQSFDKEYFFKVIEDNNLIQERKQLMRLK